MVTQLQLATTRLFGAESLRAANFKIFPGNSRDATPEQIAEQINKAISQIETGDFEDINDADAE